MHKTLTNKLKKQQNKNSIKSTIGDEILQNSFPLPDQPNLHNYHVIYVIHKHEESTAYIDLTGHLPFPLSRGNCYILVAYHHNGNAILAEPLKNRNAATITKT